MAADRTTQELAQAVQLHRAGKLEEAAKIYADIRAKSQRNFDAWHLGGTVSLQLGRTIEAVTFLGQAHQLNPRDHVCLMRLGLAEVQAGQHRAGIVRIERVLAMKPEFVDAWDNLGAARKQAGDLAGSIAAHKRAVTLNPKYAQGWSNLGLSLAMQGDMGEARKCYDRALAIDPTFRRAASARLFALQYDESMSREERFAAHRAFGEQVRLKLLPVRRVVAGEGPLKIAFLSPDFRQHSVPSFIEPILTHLDRTACVITLYMDHPGEDAVSVRLRALASNWRNVHSQSDAALETIIRADAPDVLVDLAGHTGRNRLPLFAKRLAPVQLTYLGYPDTTGVAAMDYRFTDAIADPAGAAEAFHTEKLVRFAECAWVYQAPADTPEVAPLPCATSGYITFGSFNHIAKINAATVELWASVLGAVPTSRLVLKSMGLDTPEGLARVERLLASGGIDRARVDLLGATRSVPAHLELYGRMDIALDAFPYHGTTTTCEALWMGRPVITLEGDRHASRVGVSLLTAVGHPEWIASSKADYVRIATEMAAARERLPDVSGKLRADLRSSRLMDHVGQTARFLSSVLRCAEERGVRLASSPAAPIAELV